MDPLKIQRLQPQERVSGNTFPHFLTPTTQTPRPYPTPTPPPDTHFHAHLTRHPQHHSEVWKTGVCPGYLTRAMEAVCVQTTLPHNTEYQTVSSPHGPFRHNAWKKMKYVNMKGAEHLSVACPLGMQPIAVHDSESDECERFRMHRGLSQCDPQAYRKRPQTCSWIWQPSMRSYSYRNLRKSNFHTHRAGARAPTTLDSVCRELIAEARVFSCELVGKSCLNVHLFSTIFPTVICNCIKLRILLSHGITLFLNRSYLDHNRLLMKRPVRSIPATYAEGDMLILW